MNQQKQKKNSETKHVRYKLYHITTNIFYTYYIHHKANDVHISRVIRMNFFTPFFLRHLLVKYTKRQKQFVFVYIHPFSAFLILFDVCAAQNLIKREENIFELERISISLHAKRIPLPQHLHYFPLSLPGSNSLLFWIFFLANSKHQLKNCT